MVVAMSTEVIRKDWVGQVIDARYTLRWWLGGSTESGVFLAELYVDHTQKAAIKMIPANAPDADAHLATWAKAAELVHPHLMRVFHSGRSLIGDTEVVYVAMEYAEEVLAEILPERALTPTETKEMLGPVLDALSYLHQNGLAHGHLKPSNILVVHDQLKLSVDGVQQISQRAKSPAKLSEYDAPERDTGLVSPATDIWSLGATIVEALTQHPPAWMRSSTAEPAVPRSIPAPYSQIARECLRRDPSLRCTINDIRVSRGSGTPIPHRVNQSAKPASGKGRAATLIAAIVVVLAVAAVIFMRSRTSSPSSPTVEQVAPTATASTPTSTPAPAADSTTPAQNVSESNVPAAEPTPPNTAHPSPTATAEGTSDAVPARSSAQPSPSAVFHVNGLAAKGAVLQQTIPDVPAKAMRTIHGAVRLSIRLSVDPTGNVSTARVDSPGPSPYFTNLALKAARSWRFTPPQVNGQNSASDWTLDFEFRQSGIDVTPTQQTP